MNDEGRLSPAPPTTPADTVAPPAEVYGVAARIDQQAERHFGQRPPTGLEPIAFLVAEQLERLADRKAAA
jgi:hypothetical protein